MHSKYDLNVPILHKHPRYIFFIFFLDRRRFFFDRHFFSYRHYYYFLREKNGRPLLENKRRFPDSSFSASASVKGHGSSDARISSGSSWCAPVSDEKHYLQVDLRRLHRVYSVMTYGDSTSPKWVTTYNLNYTYDLVNWKTRTRVRKTTMTIIFSIIYLLLNPVLQHPISYYTLQVYQGNKNAYHHVALHESLYIRTKALRFIPLTYVGRPCMRVDFWGLSKLPISLYFLLKIR